MSLRVVVASVVHHPQDARIAHRQIPALLAAGHEVVHLAPWADTGTFPPPGVQAVDVPRAVGRARFDALRAARRELRRACVGADVLLVHDPELLLVAPPARRGLVRVWDVHEDTAAALSLKAWLPRPLRPAAATGVRLAERAAERGWRLLLAEEAYRTRFSRAHPVVPNTTPVPDAVVPPGHDRVVYVGWLSAARGAEDYVELGRRLRGEGITVELVGQADRPTRDRLAAAAAAGAVVWRGPLPNAEALARVDGALAGLSLLHDEPNYRHSRPTKIIEYMAHGVPVITTPLPLARELVEPAGCGTVVPFGDPAAAADAVRALAADPERAAAMGRAGHRAALAEHDWRRDAERFVAVLEAWAQAAAR